MNNLSSFGVQELNANEIKTIKGGGLIADLVHWLKNRDWSCGSGC